MSTRSSPATRTRPFRMARGCRTLRGGRRRRAAAKNRTQQRLLDSPQVSRCCCCCCGAPRRGRSSGKLLRSLPVCRNSAAQQQAGRSGLSRALCSSPHARAPQIGPFFRSSSRRRPRSPCSSRRRRCCSSCCCCSPGNSPGTLRQHAAGFVKFFCHRTAAL